MRKICFKQSLTVILGTEHKEVTVSLFFVKGGLASILRPVKRRDFLRFSLLHPHNRLEIISSFSLPLFNSVVKNLFLGRNTIGGSLGPPPAPPSDDNEEEVKQQMRY
jgi:hypothetical protein